MAQAAKESLAVDSFLRRRSLSVVSRSLCGRIAPAHDFGL